MQLLHVVRLPQLCIVQCGSSQVDAVRHRFSRRIGKVEIYLFYRISCSISANAAESLITLGFPGCGNQASPESSFATFFDVRNKYNIIYYGVWLDYYTEGLLQWPRDQTALKGWITFTCVIHVLRNGFGNHNRSSSNAIRKLIEKFNTSGSELGLQRRVVRPRSVWLVANITTGSASIQRHYGNIISSSLSAVGFRPWHKKANFSESFYSHTTVGTIPAYTSLDGKSR